MRAKEFITEAFGAESPRLDYTLLPKSTRENIGDWVTGIGIAVGAVAGYKLTPDGFWGTTGGVLAGMFLGATAGQVIKGQKDSDIRIEKANNIASQLIRNNQLKTDFSLFLKSLFHDTPKSILSPDTIDKDIENWYASAGDDNESDDIRRTNIYYKDIEPWLKHYEQEWEILSKKYNVSHIVLGWAFEMLYKQSVMEAWMDLLKKKFNQYNPPFQTPFSGEVK
jgi:hypothetical protein